MHPEVTPVLRQARHLQSLMDDQLDRMENGSFAAADTTNTVEVTLNGHHWLKDIYIQDGLLRLGAETVAQSVNEALVKGGAEASASIDADRERIDAAVAEITAEMSNQERE